MGTLKALGFTQRKIVTLSTGEQIPGIVLGILLGLALSYGYNIMVFKALNTLWGDIVRTDVLIPILTAKALIQGALASGGMAFLTLTILVYRKLRHQANRLQHITTDSTNGLSKAIPCLGVTFFVTAVLLMVHQFFFSTAHNPTLFFLAGGSLLIALGTGVSYGLQKTTRYNVSRFNSFHLVISNISRNRTRSLVVILLLSIGTFIVLSTGANRKDLFTKADSSSGGTGGFLFYGETTQPILESLNTAEAAEKFNLPQGIQFIQFRKQPGDDASCLNLNKITNPQIIATHPALLEGHFSFLTQSDIPDTTDPWRALNSRNGNVIPAIADQTVIQWGLEKKTGDKLTYTDAFGDTLQLKLIAGLASSIFQGNILISEQNFLSMYPYSGGTELFLVSGNTSEADTLTQQLQQAFKGHGLFLERSSERLARFKSVENTYLSIFMVLGALGMLLGTIGLGVVLGHTLLERHNEIALFSALGFSKKKTAKIVASEYLLLLLTGVVGGAMAAIIAVFPSLISPHTGISLTYPAVITTIILLNGAFWIVIITAAMVYYARKKDN